MKEQGSFMVKKDNKLLFSVPQKLINELDKQIAIIDQEIEKVVEENQTILKNYLLVKSIPGVGRQTALHLMVTTNNFVLFDDYRKLASYAGVAPFPYSSGASIKGKNKVNPLANKKLKSLLSSCAVSAIRTDPEMKLYFKRRQEKGIHKMNTINAVRSKLLACTEDVHSTKILYRVEVCFQMTCFLDIDIAPLARLAETIIGSI